MSLSKVEETLRAQRGDWTEIARRTMAADALPLMRPHRIFLHGIGSSESAAVISRLCLRTWGEYVRGAWGNVPIFARSSVRLFEERTPAPNDWVFAFSHRGGTEETRLAQKRAADCGASCFWITTQELGEDVVNDLPGVGSGFWIGAGKREICEPHTRALTDAIVVATTLLGGKEILERWEALSSLPNPDLERLQKRVGKGPRLVLGVGSDVALSREGALKLMEMARLPVRSFEWTEYHHGPWMSEMTKGKTTRDLGETDVWQVGEAAFTARLPRALSFTDSDPIQRLVELQWASLAVALNLGVDPDGPPEP